VKTDFEAEAKVLRVLAHPGRLAILEALRNGPACVCHLTALLGRPQVYISQQLAVLRDAGLATTRRDGAFVYYSLHDYSVLGLIDMLGRAVGRAPAPALGVAPKLDQCACPQCQGAVDTAREGAVR
jgi:DNA-binding transcriptional ArsR family regulator